MTDNLIVKNESRYFFWKKHLSAWKQSGISKKKYCLQNNLALSTFGYWIQKIRMLESDNDNLVEIKIKDSIPSDKPLELIVGERVKIKLTNNFNSNLLKETLKVLGVKI
jgi:hypothetical protein